MVGKKLNISAASKIGGIDLFGFEDSPTAAEWAERIAQDDWLTAKVLDILTTFEEKECDSLNECIQKFPELSDTLTTHLKELILVLGLSMKDLRETVS